MKCVGNDKIIYEIAIGRHICPIVHNITCVCPIDLIGNHYDRVSNWTCVRLLTIILTKIQFRKEMTVTLLKLYKKNLHEIAIITLNCRFIYVKHPGYCKKVFR